MSTKQPLPGYISFKQAEKTYDVTYRQLGILRDRNRNTNRGVSRKFKLRVVDPEHVYENDKVTPDFVRKLSGSDRRNPQWFVSVKFLDSEYGKRGDSSNDATASKEKGGDDAKSTPGPTSGNSARRTDFRDGFDLAKSELTPLFDARMKEVREQFQDRIADIKGELANVRKDANLDKDRFDKAHERLTELTKEVSKSFQLPEIAKELAKQQRLAGENPLQRSEGNVVVDVKPDSTPPSTPPVAQSETKPPTPPQQPGKSKRSADEEKSRTRLERLKDFLMRP